MSTTSTHHALFIDEIIVDVVRHAEHDRDLAALARVSRSFSEHALDALWFQLDSCVPLLRCLPDGLIGEEIHDSLLTYTIQRPITSADWTIFLKHARRVVHLDWGLGSRALSIDGKDSSAAQAIHPEVLNVLSAPPVSHPFPKLLPQSLASSSSWERCLSIRPLYPSSSHWEIYVRRCASSSGTLRLPALDIPSFRQLSSSKSLQELLTELQEPFPDNIQFDGPAFPAITFLTLRTPPRRTLKVFADIIKKMSISSKMFNLFADSTEEAALADLIGAISAHCNPEILDYLMIVENDISQHREPHFCMTSSTLRPALRLSSLASFDINTDRSVQLNNDDLLEMASAWPKLGNLSLNYHSGWRIHSQATLIVLRGLLDRLPRLKRLSIAVDAERALTDDKILQELTHSSSINPRTAVPAFKLDLLDSRIGAGARIINAIAEFLSDLFPSFRYFDYWQVQNPTHADARTQAEQWSAVKREMESMRQVKSQEKAR
ncbi:hypothetical protein CONPUDRAFT_167546 [Coniophora puteana RWD-64-598 SS2]|uniref:F-box domain-containing protein n=1 Tax=Coniophora puteana (strain RWD-64-598) TaxID=741705 RepID=A0A5M3MHR9_CONPW|nr:uncharacterized protein CONPUDRAFT_167546 [Coniophora puteana RWD-64-598 SS2]EIW78556.1 hypothetical protein CONPUDRAFT_167546 [Coniophora puteana RWD-64-598 SS2]